MKLHPSDTSHEDWKSFCEIYRYKVHIRQSYNPMWLAAGADILIVYQSTFALDGLAFNTPVIITSECQIDKYFSLPWFRDGTTDKKLCESMDYILRVGNLDSTEYYTALKRCLHKEQLYPRMHYGKKSSAQLAELLKGQYTQ